MIAHSTVTFATPKGHEKRYGVGRFTAQSDMVGLAAWAAENKLSLVDAQVHTYPIREAMDNASLDLLDAVRRPGVKRRGKLKTGPLRQR